VLVLRKKTPKAEYWPRLTKEKPNRNWIKTDFSKVRRKAQHFQLLWTCTASVGGAS
jgi:hypothetical protein